MSAKLHIAPRAQTLLTALGLTDADRILALPGPVVSGHPDRHVRRVVLGRGASRVTAYLKIEHRVPWRDRLVNAIAGYGFVAKSLREMQLLDALAEAHLPAPTWLAAGTDSQGRAFLLVRALDDAYELRDVLADRPLPGERRRLARRLGTALGRLHAAGFVNPDLHVKHVYVNAITGEIALLDWQRGWRGQPGPMSVIRPLALLDATLAPGLCNRGDRCAALAAFVRAAGLPDEPSLARAIARRSEQLCQRRSIRDAHQPTSPLPQELLWLAGESLCAVPELAEMIPTEQLHDLAYGGEPGTRRLTLPDGTPAVLTCRREWRGLSRLALGLLARGWRAPELRQAGQLFRSARRGEPAPRLLGFGQRLHTGGRVDSFLLVADDAMVEVPA